jgi:hypothetical protein
MFCNNLEEGATDVNGAGNEQLQLFLSMPAVKGQPLLALPFTMTLLSQKQVNHW